MRIRGHRLLFVTSYCNLEGPHGLDCVPFHQPTCQCGWEGGSTDTQDFPGIRSHTMHLVWVRRDMSRRPPWTIRVIAWLRRRLRREQSVQTV